VRQTPAWPRSWTNFSFFFFSCIPTGMHGPTCIFLANLTPFSLGSGSTRPRGAGGTRSARARTATRATASSR
jgi:hypothetical protein